MNCPKCGFQQGESPECLRCGLIFARYHSGTESVHPQVSHNESPPRQTIGAFRRFYRIFRWFSLAGLIVVLFLMLRPSAPPQIEASPQSAERAGAKIEEFQSSFGTGGEQRLEMDESELNGWLTNNLALKKPAGAMSAMPQTTGSLIELAKTATGGDSVSNEDLLRAQSSIRDIKIELQEDALRVYALFDFHGMDLSLELEGQPVVRNGYIKLEPSGGKFGSLPLTLGTLQSVADRLFESPGNKEKFKLPSNIQDIRIEQGQLVVVSR